MQIMSFMHRNLMKRKGAVFPRLFWYSDGFPVFRYISPRRKYAAAVSAQSNPIPEL